MKIALSCGLSRRRITADLGIGKSTLGKWIVNYCPSEPVSGPQADLARENERLRLHTDHWWSSEQPVFHLEGSKNPPFGRL